MNSAIEYAYNRYCSERFPLPTELRVRAIEREIRVTLPVDYREFLLQYNGGMFESDDENDIQPMEPGMPQTSLRVLYGIGASHPSYELSEPAHTAIFDGNDPPKLLPIGATLTGGLFILNLWPENYGEILFKKEWGDFYYLADGIEEFFGLLRDFEE